MKRPLLLPGSMQTSARHVAHSPGLECRVGERRLAIPMRYVDQLIEYERTPLPLARAGVRGLGVYEGQLVLSLGLPFAAPVSVQGLTKGVSLRGLPLDLLCALEVDQTFGFVEVAAPKTQANLDTWTNASTDANGGALFELDLDSLLQALRLPRAL